MVVEMEENSKDKKGALVCPHCGVKLIWDSEKKALYSAVAGMPADKNFSLEKAVAAIKSEQDRAEEKFKEAMEAENKRKQNLSRLFEKSLKEAERDPNPPRNPFDYE
jgi:hypothetical protein